MGFLAFSVAAIAAVPAGMGILAVSFRYDNRFGAVLCYLGVGLMLAGIISIVLIGAAGFGK